MTWNGVWTTLSLQNLTFHLPTLQASEAVQTQNLFTYFIIRWWEIYNMYYKIDTKRQIVLTCAICGVIASWSCGLTSYIPGRQRVITWKVSFRTEKNKILIVLFQQVLIKFLPEALMPSHNLLGTPKFARVRRFPPLLIRAAPTAHPNNNFTTNILSILTIKSRVRGSSS